MPAPTTTELPKIMQRTCPGCNAKLDSDLPYCGACGLGLPKFPRPLALTAGSLALFDLIGLPAGLFAAVLAIYGVVLSEWHAILPTTILSLVFSGLLWFMLEMSEGTRVCKR